MSKLYSVLEGSASIGVLIAFLANDIEYVALMIAFTALFGVQGLKLKSQEES